MQMRRFTLPAALFLLTTASMTLLGCGSGGTFTVDSSAPQKAETLGLITVVSTVKLGPIFGPPKATSDRMVFLINAAAAKAQLALMNYDGAEGDYFLRGDLHATRYRGKIRLTYNWYVLNKQGKEVGHKSGVELADAASAEGDPWSAVPDAKLEVIAGQAITAIVSRR
jgi:hypothetical protein